MDGQQFLHPRPLHGILSAGPFQKSNPLFWCGQVQRFEEDVPIRARMGWFGVAHINGFTSKNAIERPITPRIFNFFRAPDDLTLNQVLKSARMARSSQARAKAQYRSAVRGASPSASPTSGMVSPTK